MNNLKVFSFDDNEVRTLIIDNDPYFVGRDIAKVLGYSNLQKAVRDHVDLEDRGLNEMDTPSGTQKMTVINESGMYSLVLSSKLPSAKKFKHWVTSEVLPSLRSKGAYITQESAVNLMQNPRKLAEILNEFADTQDKLKSVQQENQSMKPKALFADTVSASKSTILVGDLAKMLRQKGIDIGQNRLFAWLRDKGYLISRMGSNKNVPTQRSIEAGLFEIKESVHTDGNGNNVISKTPKVTGKGQLYFIDKIIKENSLEVANVD